MHCATPSLSEQLQKFWELEKVAFKSPESPGDVFVEQQFPESHYRDKDGRYVVRLPINCESIVLGNSRKAAIQFFHSTERKIFKSPLLRDKYVDFINKYAQLDHMCLTDYRSDNTKFYVPHHAAFRKHDPNRKIRVVFNTSFKSSSSFSLNDKLLIGPKLQSELWVILSRWRLFQFAFTTDIVKMYRQIKVNPFDQDLQKVLCRDNPDSEIS